MAQTENFPNNPATVNIEPRNTERQSTGRRVALVIGNASYPSPGQLRNPVNDARDMASVLQSLGFEVILSTDSSLQQMDEDIREFYRAIQQGSVGVFYYAGHGIQSKGENYLIPVDAQIEAEQELPYAAVPLGRVLGLMDAADNDVNVVILDACRNNPFERRWRSTSERGLANVDAARGFFIAYATGPGEVAEDGEGSNGTFTAALLEYIQTPDLRIGDLFIAVRNRVLQQTNDEQTPWETSSLTGYFAFNSTEGSRGPKPPQPELLQPEPPEPEPPLVCPGSVCSGLPQ